MDWKIFSYRGVPPELRHCGRIVSPGPCRMGDRGCTADPRLALVGDGGHCGLLVLVMDVREVAAQVLAGHARG